MKIKSINEKIERLKKEILKLGPMRPGSMSEQYNVCGVKKCRCKDPENPQKHGPYFKLSYVIQGKNKSQFIRPAFQESIASELSAFKRFKEISQEWVLLEIERSNLKMQSAIEENQKEKAKTRPKS